MSKSFISYSHTNNDKRIILDKLLRSSRLYPIVVASRNKPSMLLAAKVEEAIEEADFLIPILTEDSIHNQWVNQEIGYANKLAKDSKLQIIPIIEKSIMDNLKGFVHKQLDLPFIFKGNTSKDIENKNFKEQCIKLIRYLKTKGSPKKYISGLNATFSYLSTSTYENNLKLYSTMILENTGNKTIALRDIFISFSITYNKYSGYKKIGTAQKKISYETDHYTQNNREISIRYQPILLRPREVKKLQNLRFRPIKFLYDRRKDDISIGLDAILKTMESLVVTFQLLSADKFEKNVKILHPSQNFSIV